MFTYTMMYGYLKWKMWLNWLGRVKTMINVALSKINTSVCIGLGVLDIIAFTIKSNIIHTEWTSGLFWNVKQPFLSLLVGYFWVTGGRKPFRALKQPKFIWCSYVQNFLHALPADEKESVTLSVYNSKWFKTKILHLYRH